MGTHEDSDSQQSPATDAIAPGGITALIARLAHPAAQGAAPMLLPGARVGRYEIIRAIGRGGFGEVYEAHDTALNRLVALKVLRPAEAVDPAAPREGEAAARLSHPNIAAIHDVGAVDGGSMYLVYEILHGETLESRLARGSIPPGEAVGIAVQVARALAHAHAHGVIHRDLKPANVFLTAEGDVKVLDFGIALLLGRSAPAGGTPAYMAPEQRRGEPEDARTDLYALGRLLQEMLTGEREGTAAATHERVPAPVRRLLALLLAEDPARRPRGARAALADLQAAARACATPRVRRRWVMIVAAVMLAIGVTALLRAWLQGRSSVPHAVPPSIAVLPFADLSPGHDQGYFSDGLAEEILNALTHVEGLHVAGRTSSFSFKGKPDDLRTIARRLDVAAVLEGSVRQAGKRVRITAQLVNAADGYELWSESYDRELSDVFAVQDDIARAVVGALAVKLLPGSPPSTEAYLTRDPEVHTQYLLGRYFWNAEDTSGRAVQAFENALARDPSYAPAWAGFAVAVFDQGDRAQTVAGLREGCRRGLEAAEKAVGLGPALPEAFSTRGLLRWACRWDWDGAASDLKRALEIAPGDSSARRRWGVLQLTFGRVPEATATLRSAIQADPLSGLTWRWLGTAKLAASEFASAREALNRALQIVPRSPYTLYLLALASLLQGDAEAALVVNRRAPADDTDGLVVRALAERARGHEREFRAALEALDKKCAEGDTWAPLDLARAYAWSGERDRALEWLDRAVSAHVGDLWFMKTDPLLRPVRSDDRFKALLRRMNLPPD